MDVWSFANSVSRLSKRTIFQKCLTANLLDLAQYTYSRDLVADILLRVSQSLSLIQCLVKKHKYITHALSDLIFSRITQTVEAKLIIVTVVSQALYRRDIKSKKSKIDLGNAEKNLGSYLKHIHITVLLGFRTSVNAYPIRSLLIRYRLGSVV